MNLHPGARTFSVTSPVDGSTYVTRFYADGTAIEAALTRARAALPSWRRVPLAERLAILLRFGEEMKARAAPLAEMVAWQIGRPLWQADETPRLALIGQLLADVAPETLADVPYPSDENIRRYARPVAGGLHLSICAWNYPTAMLGYLITAPLAAGNVVVFKHSPQTPLIAEVAEEAFRAAGGPEGVFQSLHLDHADAERLIASGAFNAVNFIGSVNGGRRVHAAAAGTFTQVHLELGGKDPTYVRADADLEAAIPQIAEGAYSNAGQSCCSVERIYVDQAIHDRFVDALVAETAKWTVGHPIGDKPMVGPVVRASAADTIRDLTESAVRAGARRLMPQDGKAAGLGAAYIAPEVLVGVDHGMPIMRDELFGPVACIQSVGGDDEALRLMNDSDFGLSASIWTQDIDRGVALLDEVEAGTVYLNRCDHADLHLPWGGIKNSGLGRTNGRAGLTEATAAKAYHVRSVIG
ncbi:aldehyde dehydrogenase family protein [Mesorhizobium sp. YC-39]|uniref:aldehyde dehydrogenase family protein n=1 Tax=unclassified Mesorhizobium TaxID=325217 RepID=UPI0021E99A47|nr:MULTISPECIES: aldehyde dehydrogenase family protein [unclassified Mesorhizobium]MCV3209056.1 aldehyde dehydrogenase family protein [Mesorhizobium sp. YC-2]MCV3231594.1 aldehyde dehydrogenase family protein [Mesorhizobium sp. YC-39]